VREVGDSTWAAALGRAFAEERWRAVMGSVGPVRVMGSLALDLAWTAAGRLDALAYTCDRRPWDVWAGQVMAREQGLEVREEPDARLLVVLPAGWWDELGLGRRA
jgi:fructose-1,6-bisphosphatase/inositol monophosphatase family enzyme